VCLIRIGILMLLVVTFQFRPGIFPALPGKFPVSVAENSGFKKPKVPVSKLEIPVAVWPKIPVSVTENSGFLNRRFRFHGS
jgi:hypothetical protein